MIAVIGRHRLRLRHRRHRGRQPGRDVLHRQQLVVLTPELGYFTSTRRPRFGIAARIGLPIGANVNGCTRRTRRRRRVLLRLRYALSPSGEGIRVMGQVGGGVLRNTIKLDSASRPAWTPTSSRQGPLLIGAGVGFTQEARRQPSSFVADVSALAGIAVVQQARRPQAQQRRRRRPLARPRARLLAAGQRLSIGS